MSHRFSLCALASAVALALAPTAAEAYTVTNTADSGPGSLRQAILDANANCASLPAPVIDFNIASGPFVISPATPLPSLGCASASFNPVIDGYTQPGASPNTLAEGFDANIPIVLSGAAGALDVGLEYRFPPATPGALTIRGLEFRDFNFAAAWGTFTFVGNRVVKASMNSTSKGVYAEYSGAIGDGTPAGRNAIGGVDFGVYVGQSVTTLTINGNFLGTLDGTTATPNGTGIYAGGNAPMSVLGNVVSGNQAQGISLASDTGSLIESNYIGTNAAGTAALANNTGISIVNSSGTLVANNLISGNLRGIGAFQVTSLQITDNRIGTDVSGLQPVPNSDGISVNCGSLVRVANNLISGNGNAVILAGIDGDGSPNVENNWIGVGSDGVTAIPNQNGVAIEVGSCGTASDNYLYGNVIAYTAFDGVGLNAGVGNTLSQNLVYGSGGKNINIARTIGPLPNDPGDADSGPNNQQNYPAIVYVLPGDGTTTVQWNLDSTPGGTFFLEFFANPAAGKPAGQIFVGSTTAGNGPGTFSVFGTYDNLSMTATDLATGDTSEFSAIVSVVATPAVSIAPASLAFGNVAVGTTSPAQSSTLTSTGIMNYQVNAFDASALCYGAPLCYGGPFICSSNCALTPASYAAGESCSITASFAPLALGPQTTTIYICDNAAGSPHTVTLSGTGVAVQPLVITPASQDFGGVPVFTASVPITFNIANPGALPAPLSSQATSGPFITGASNCGATLGPFSSCNTGVSFAPTAAGPASGTFTVTSGTTRVSAALTGTGTQAPQLVLPPPIDLGAYVLGSAPLSQAITLQNTGGSALDFSVVSVTPPFTLADSCPARLEPGASCTIAVGFSSTTAGNFSGTLTIVTNGGSGTVAITATAQPAPIPLIGVSPKQIGFGNRLAGTTSAAEVVTITNEGGAAAALTGLSVSPDYLVTSTTCSTTLAPGARCVAHVAMNPVGFGLRVGQMIVGSNASNAPSTVSLAGTGCRPFTASANRFGARSSCAP